MTDVTTRRRPPAPVSISEQAQQVLNAAPQVQEPEPYPRDTQGWLRWVETREALA